MDFFLDYINVHKQILLIHNPNISKYNVVSSLLSLNTFVDKDLIIITDDKKEINSCFSSNIPDSILYSYDQNIKVNYSSEYVHIILDSIQSLCKHNNIITIWTTKIIEDMFM